MIRVVITVWFDLVLVLVLVEVFLFFFRILLFFSLFV